MGFKRFATQILWIRLQPPWAGRCRVGGGGGGCIVLFTFREEEEDDDEERKREEETNVKGGHGHMFI